MVETTPDSAVANLIAQLADNKQFLGRRYAEWCTAAPTLESAVAAASMAQDEIGHARSLYPILRDVIGLSSEVDPETRTQHVYAAFLRTPFRGWVDFVAANFLFDTAISVLLEGAQDSSCQPLAQRARRILEEEPLHWLHGEGWTRRLPSRGPAVRDALAVAMRRVAPDAIAWFDVADDSIVKSGVLADTDSQAKARFLDRVNPVLTTAGLPRL